MRNVIWTAVSISRMYIPPLLSSQTDAAIQLNDYTLQWSTWEDFHETSKDGTRAGKKLVLPLEKPLNEKLLVIKPFKCSAVRFQRLENYLVPFPVCS